MKTLQWLGVTKDISTLPEIKNHFRNLEALVKLVDNGFLNVVKDENDELVDSCPWCGNLTNEGHHPGCEFLKVMKEIK